VCADRRAVRARAGQVGVNDIVVPAFDLDSWDPIRDLCGLEGVHPAIGLHPWAAHQVVTEDSPKTEDTARIFPGPKDGSRGPPTGDPAEVLDPWTIIEFRDRLASTLAECQAVAIGEIGLDFIVKQPPQSHQLAILRSQLALAVDLDLPVILHCRNAWEMLVGALQAFAGRITGILHAYTRHPELAGPFLKCGFFVGFGGAITQSQAKRARRSAEALPLDRILLETDAPTTGLDGIDPERTEPCHVRDVAKTLANIRGVTIEQIAETTTHNARELFRL